MGGKGSGRPRDVKRAARAAKLRAKGLTVQEIGVRLRTTRQADYSLLVRHGQAQAPPVEVRCTSCKTVVLSGHFTQHPNRHVLCLACLEKRPDAPFGQRLKAFRLAAGLTQLQLAERAGINPATLGHLEKLSDHSPRWLDLAALLKVLGPGLVTLGIVADKSEGK